MRFAEVRLERAIFENVEPPTRRNTTSEQIGLFEVNDVGHQGGGQLNGGAPILKPED